MEAGGDAAAPAPGDAEDLEDTRLPSEEAGDGGGVQEDPTDSEDRSLEETGSETKDQPPSLLSPLPQSESPSCTHGLWDPAASENNAMDDSESGSGGQGGDPSDEDWRSKRKHVFVLSEAGKPIYSRYGSVEALSTTMGVMTALVSFVQSAGDTIRAIYAGETKPLKTEDLLSMVKKLQKEGSLEPQIEDLISRINELQQAKKKSSEELGETQALWETLHRELDSLNGEKVHLEEVLRKKQEALRILQLHCQRKESEAQRSHMEEQLEDFMGQHKDLWEFQVLERRLAWEIRTLQSSKEQLLTEENLARAKLEQVEQRLRPSPTVQGALAVNEELKVELEKSGEQVPTQTQSPSGDWAHKEEVRSQGWRRGGQRGRQSGRGCPQSPSEGGSVGSRAPQVLTVTGQRQPRA
ncbi:vacuolar fusion protein MON1 homolog B isoform X4 [Myotis yumanensis]|uniref:vacuolar fusion protein MON1 homolog B isoform X4 n=1 Tax=Myotis yumanensis TaxID=159337 RepID=UPI0038D41B5C